MEILLRNWYIVCYLDAFSPDNLTLESAKYLQQGRQAKIKLLHLIEGFKQLVAIIKQMRAPFRIPKLFYC